MIPKRVKNLLIWAIFRCLGDPPEEEERRGEKKGKRRGRGGKRGGRRGRREGGKRGRREEGRRKEEGRKKEGGKKEEGRREGKGGEEGGRRRKKKEEGRRKEQEQENGKHQAAAQEEQRKQPKKLEVVEEGEVTDKLDPSVGLERTTTMEFQASRMNLREDDAEEEDSAPQRRPRTSTAEFLTSRAQLRELVPGSSEQPTGQLTENPIERPAEQPAPSPTMLPPASSPTVTAPSDDGELDAFMQACRLDVYSTVLRELGAEIVEDLEDVDDEDLQGLGMKKLEVRRFRKVLKNWNSGPLTAGAPALESLEQPVELLASQTAPVAPPNVSAPPLDPELVLVRAKFDMFDADGVIPLSP